MLHRHSSNKRRNCSLVLRKIDFCVTLEAKSGKRKGLVMETIHPSTSGPRILIADDHAIFTEALRAYLEKRFTVVGVAADGRAMLQEAIRLRPDVIVADVAMPTPERTGGGPQN
jgi:PleD family two-component response regulator